MALFDPQSHEPLLDEPWDPASIEAAIREIVAETEAAFDDGWAVHPEEEGRMKAMDIAEVLALSVRPLEGAERAEEAAPA